MKRYMPRCVRPPPHMAQLSAGSLGKHIQGSLQAAHLQLELGPASCK